MPEIVQQKGKVKQANEDTEDMENGNMMAAKVEAKEHMEKA